VSFGLWFPISGEMLAIAFLIAIVCMFVYSIFYFLRSTGKKVQLEQFKEKIDREPAAFEKSFGFPEGTFDFYVNKYFDSRLGFATQRTEGQFGLSMCVHSRLPHLRLYFFIDFSELGRIQAIIYLIANDEKRLMLKQTPESTMFAHNEVRYFDLPVSEGRFFLENLRAIEVDEQHVQIDTPLRDRLTRSINEFYGFDESTRDKFLTWRKAS
jgi:hypothetical protein